MPDTVRTVATLLSSLLQDGQAAGSITPQDMRDVVVSLLAPETTVTFAAPMTWDMDTNPTARVVMTSSTTITFSNGANGQTYRLVITQDGTGSRTPTIAGATLLGTATWQTGANAVNIVNVDVVNGTRYYTVT
jgi:hypothetical protein